ncbi:hypothetical protein CcrColossus_gp440 [Caulobacter phage CcrColossus]|uniref:Uncharacterized protein n=1 Tax=Caulobacter phage CcrColossus TaxID=1211640 RepID=K4JVB5_9CAUD|nr:hypothetical protein CcrColossus_gp440 [Caulobacter phage CcrColossus]AFU88310.1 hypothetical protein CcrColossus_gp440 [Caulobacter phage CcrColossus]
MSRIPQIQKTIHGVPVDHTTYLRAILDEIDRYPDGARNADVARGLGPEWAELPLRTVLSQTLVNMARRNLIYRDLGERGLYKVSMVARRSGVNKFDSDEQSILAAIRAEGGICQWRDILDAHDCRPKGVDASIIKASPLYSRLTRVIANSQLIRQDFAARGVYNLPWAELGSLPLRGKWFALMSKVSFIESSAKAKLDVDLNVWRDQRDAYFAHVGEAFANLRKQFGDSEDDLLADSRVYGAVVTLARAAPKEVNIIRAEWRDRTDVWVQARRDAAEAEADALEAEGKTWSHLQPIVRQDIEEYRAGRDDEWDKKHIRWLYSRFERGTVGTHVHAPLLLYTAVAEHYGKCPAALSRGLIVDKPHDDVRLRPHRTRRTSWEMIEEQIAHEVADERQRELLYQDDIDLDEELDIDETPSSM